jgi:hypothetical protein
MDMFADYAQAYGALPPVFEDEFRAAYARRDPTIIYPAPCPAMMLVGASFPMPLAAEP